MFGRSFFTAGAMMSLIALPLVVGATREALQAIPAPRARGLLRARQDEGRDDPPRAAARRARPGIATGTALGMGRIAGDTAIVVILLGAIAAAPGRGRRRRCSSTLQGTGSTLTSYVYNNSPAGEGNAPEKAYAAAFVLLMIVIVLNFAVDLIVAPKERTAWSTLTAAARSGASCVDAEPTVVRRRRAPRRRRQRRPRLGRPRRRRARRARRERGARSRAHAGRGAVGRLRRQARRQRGHAAGPPGRGARADRPVRLRQDDAAALAQPARRADADGDRARARSRSTARTSTRSRSPSCAAA